jgi:hypothetical protein
MPDARREDSPSPDDSPRIAELDESIAAVTENLRELTEQAAAYSGAADDELASERIEEQEAELERLRTERDALTGRQP